ncbi:hypothetical protein TNCV_3762661 [Trichonephila clavipes]|nr:hypothetical protein TNCV_3762661 [Trichonephila clavipes]
MSASKILITIFWDANGLLCMEFLTKGLTVNSNSTLQHCNYSSNAYIETDRKETSFFCITTMQDHFAVHCGHLGKTEIYSGSTTFLQSRFGTIGLLVVPKIEGNIDGLTFFNGSRSSGRRAKMDLQSTRTWME